jgi:hypothetical protein
MDPHAETVRIGNTDLDLVAAKLRRKNYRNVVFLIGLEGSPDRQQGQCERAILSKKS